MKAILQVLFVASLAIGAGHAQTPAPARTVPSQKQPAAASPSMQTPPPHTNKVDKTDAEWRRQLTPEQYRVLRQRGTERPFTGQYWRHHANGRYVCAGCGQELFVSNTKFDSGCGWPSFYAPTSAGAVAAREDRSHGMIRTEVLCSRCGGHLGHVFNDGPAPTGLRYCINSVALKFEPATNPPPPQANRPTPPPR